MKIGKRERETIDFDRCFPDWAARFHINNKLFVCGGVRFSVEEELHFLVSTLFSSGTSV